MKRYARFAAMGLAGLITAAVLAFTVLLVVSPSIGAFPWLPSAYDSKEACSCRYVEGRDADACAKFVAQDIVPISSRSFDDASKSVTTTALGISATATWKSTKEGCNLGN